MFEMGGRGFGVGVCDGKVAILLVVVAAGLFSRSDSDISYRGARELESWGWFSYHNTVRTTEH